MDAWDGLSGSPNFAELQVLALSSKLCPCRRLYPDDIFELEVGDAYTVKSCFVCRALSNILRVVTFPYVVIGGFMQ
jgi:hypothetical protein